MIKPIYWEDGAVHILDQTLLPEKEVWVVVKSTREMAKAIQEMKIRGAPNLGIAASYGIVLGIWNYFGSLEELPEVYHSWCEWLQKARPTAFNLPRALSLFRPLFKPENLSSTTLSELKEQALCIAHGLVQAEETACEQIGIHGERLIPPRARILTLCNTGSLAAYGIGTALGVIRKAHQALKNIFVWVMETRPWLQGARLTAWELQQDKIPFRLIVDSAAGELMREGEVDLVIVGADRIAHNGDTANKIGTYPLAILAHYHNIPFYVAAPRSTFELTRHDGSHIPIEERPENEVLALRQVPLAPQQTKAYNPVFDITPAYLITAFITNTGVYTPSQIPAL